MASKNPKVHSGPTHAAAVKEIQKSVQAARDARARGDAHGRLLETAIHEQIDKDLDHLT